jgi:hypothetical protein
VAENGSNGRRVSDHVVMTLAKIIAEAKAGNVEAVAIVTVDPSGRPRVHFGGEGDLVPSINLGLDIMKATFMAQIVEAPGARQMNSGLVIPGAN